MATAFVKWNPEINKGSFRDVVSAAMETTGNTRGATPEHAVLTWSVRMNDALDIGDTVYMVLWNEKKGGFRGILGKGVVIGRAEQGKNWHQGKPRYAWYITIRFTTMFLPEQKMRPNLITRYLPGRAWPEAQSGQKLSATASAIIDREWSKYVVKRFLGKCPHCGSAWVTPFGVTPESETWGEDFDQCLKPGETGFSKKKFAAVMADFEYDLSQCDCCDCDADCVKPDGGKCDCETHPKTSADGSDTCECGCKADCGCDCGDSRVPPEGYYVTRKCGACGARWFPKR